MALPGFHVDVRADFRHLEREIAYIDSWVITYAQAGALTKTAHDIRVEERSVMEQVFDRPTRFALNSLYVRGASKNNLQATVEFKEGWNSIPAWKFLQPQIHGGPRVHKRFEVALIKAGIMRKEEFAVPALGAQLDAHGNIAGRDIVRILSQLQAAEQGAGYAQNMTAKSRRSAIKSAGGRYILLRQEEGAQGSKVFGRARDGIYLREPGGRKIVPVLIFVKQPMYQKRYPYFSTAARVVTISYPKHFRAIWQSLVARRGARRAA